ncbi:hypothetical protein TCDM_09716 [Trypanosoma cruzi Dm28c]|uniref:Uncharacterized protein n=1 Tax=Trypanosoma cruzi Dm28c TaxID=1416333 RepID=V5BDX0_TRYCR|nr:hypothetical protein TCDM_09716 [Trypanosoma cruzi Dm28c]
MICCPQTPPSVVFQQKRKKKRSQTNSKRNLHTQLVHHRGASLLSPQVKQAPSHHPQGSPQTRQIVKYATRSAVTIVFPIEQPTSVHRVCQAGHTPGLSLQRKKDSEIRNGSHRCRWLRRRVEVWDGQMKEEKQNGQISPRNPAFHAVPMARGSSGNAWETHPPHSHAPSFTAPQSSPASLVKHTARLSGMASSLLGEKGRVAMAPLPASPVFLFSLCFWWHVTEWERTSCPSALLSVHAQNREGNNKRVGQAARRNKCEGNKQNNRTNKESDGYARGIFSGNWCHLQWIT